VFARVDLAGGNFEEHTAQRVAILAFEEQLAVVEQRDDHHGTRVLHIFAHRLVTVGQADLVGEHLEQFAVENLLAGEGVFHKVGFVHIHCRDLICLELYQISNIL